MELEAALRKLPGVALDYFFGTPQRRTFTYTKPLVLRPGKPPRELNRLDMKNWTPTPPACAERWSKPCGRWGQRWMRSSSWTRSISRRPASSPGKSWRRWAPWPRASACRFSRTAANGLRDFPPLTLKMNRAELGRLSRPARPVHACIQKTACQLAARNQHPVFVTLAEQGIVGAALGRMRARAKVPIRGPIDIVGAGDSVTANLAAGLAAGASLSEALELANAAASIVIHKLGTTGTASIREIQKLVKNA